jgi:hypothetical protein
VTMSCRELCLGMTEIPEPPLVESARERGTRDFWAKVLIFFFDK